MARQQEVRDALADSVLVTTVPADQLPLHNLGLHQEVVQILERLLIALQLLRSRGLRRQSWEAQLVFI